MKNVTELTNSKKSKQQQLPIGLANISFLNRQSARYHKVFDGAYNGKLMQVKAGGNIGSTQPLPGPFGHKVQGVVMTKEGYMAYTRLCSVTEYESHTAYEIDPAAAAMAYDEVLTDDDITELYQAIDNTHRGF